MSDTDDDIPPSLSSLEEQVNALKLRDQAGASTSGRSEEDSLRVANVVVMAPNSKQGSSKQGSAPAAPPAFKKGFFDAPPKRRVKPPAADKPAPKAPEEDIPMIRAKQGANSGPSIPDFLRLEPDEAAKRYMATKAELVEKLKPTPDLMSRIGQDPGLLASFDDPEIMAAVSDIAANPGNLSKYRNNAKVKAFYEAMGKMAGEHLHKSDKPKPGSS